MKNSLGCALGVFGLWLATGCGPPPPPPPPTNPPRVTLVAEATRVADVDLDVDINVSGCAAVTALEIWDREKLVASPQYAGNPTRVTLPPASFEYTKIAEDLVAVREGPL